ncbi:hypothetical protein BKA62DRAFT_683028 [Auriculariales sp. MPI-PUGE-AT-0066]|nr:hypothetical protein BKA62DRAFT_683028 [Auriculariales sp. MPI-PUGE-AT-0066]
MHLVLTGATGTVGTGVLTHCLASTRVTRLSILSRRPFDLPTGPGLDASKAQVIVHTDYLNYPSELLDHLKDVKGVIWSQGVSQTQVSKEEYIKVTHDHPIAAAKAFARAASSPMNFTYVSAEGASPEENIKGRTEKSPLALSQASDAAFVPLRVFNVRPGAVEPVTGNDLQGFRRTLVKLSAPVIKLAVPSLFIHRDKLAVTLVDLALGNGEPLPSGPGIEAGGRTLQNSAIRAWKPIE